MQSDEKIYSASAALSLRGIALDFLGNFRSTVLLVSSAPDFVSFPCMTPSSAALETLFPAQNILRNTALLRFPRKSVAFAENIICGVC